MTELMNLEQVAKQLDLDIETIRRAARSGELQAAKFGNRYKTKEEWVEAWVAKKLVKKQ